MRLYAFSRCAELVHLDPLLIRSCPGLARNWTVLSDLGSIFSRVLRQKHAAAKSRDCVPVRIFRKFGRTLGHILTKFQFLF